MASSGQSCPLQALAKRSRTHPRLPHRLSAAVPLLPRYTQHLFHHCVMERRPHLLDQLRFIDGPRAIG